MIPIPEIRKVLPIRSRQCRPHKEVRDDDGSLVCIKCYRRRYITPELYQSFYANGVSMKRIVRHKELL